MNYCLYCGKTFNLSNKKLTQYCWHTSCIKKFFGTNKFPDIDLSENILNKLASESINKGYTVPGVQKKLSLHLTDGDNPRLTLVNYPTGYILKPQTADYRALPEMEYLAMSMAKATGIKTVPFGLIIMQSQINNFAYITKRVDRIDDKKLAMEDFCQLDGRLTEDKYRGSYERCAKIINKYSSNPGLDLAEMFVRIVFSFVVGNSDMHLKNFSLIESAHNPNEYSLSPAYDMLSTNVIIPSDTEQFALTLNGKKSNIHKRDFIIFSSSIGISEKTAEKMINGVVKLKDKYIDMCVNSYIPDDMKEQLINLINNRIDSLIV